MAKCQSLFSGGCFIHMGCLCPCFRAVLFIVKKKAAPHEAAFSPQRNPVPSHPLCPMSSVSAWSTAAAVRGTTARAIHESPVISAEIDDEVLDFSAVFPVDTEFLPFSGKVEGERRYHLLISPAPSFHFLCALGNIRSRFLQNRGPFMSLYYISNGRSSFLKR